ncbi:Lectin/endochitinase 1 [Linum grandiflorum]
MNKILLIVTLLALVVLVPQPATGNHTRHERRDHRCGPSFNCTPCHKHRCCSVFSYCGGGDDYCDPYTCAYQCGFDGPPCKPKVNITSRFEEEMNQAAYNGSATVGCGLTTRTDVSMGWIREHGRRLFCDSRDVSCGECLKVNYEKISTKLEKN